MNAASIERSHRLQRVSTLLSDGQDHSTRDIIQSACVCAVNSIISELRANGKKIGCRRTGGMWIYRMELNHAD